KETSSARTRSELARSVSWLDSAGRPAKASRGGGPQPARDGSAASHLEGRLRFMQVGPPPSSRAPIVQRDSGRRQRFGPNPPDQPATPPPSTGRAAPVMKEDSSQARKRTARAISSGSPMRPSGRSEAHST